MAADEDSLTSHRCLPEDLRYYSPREPQQKDLPKKEGQTGHRVMGGEGDTWAAFQQQPSLLVFECPSDTTSLH